MLRSLVTRRRFRKLCPNCGCETLHEEYIPNKIVTIFLIVVSCGGYLLILLFDLISFRSGKCKKCGSDNSPPDLEATGIGE